MQCAILLGHTVHAVLHHFIWEKLVQTCNNRNTLSDDYYAIIRINFILLLHRKPEGQSQIQREIRTQKHDNKYRNVTTNI